MYINNYCIKYFKTFTYNNTVNCWHTKNLYTKISIVNKKIFSKVFNKKLRETYRYNNHPILG